MRNVVPHLYIVNCMYDSARGTTFALLKYVVSVQECQHASLTMSRSNCKRFVHSNFFSFFFFLGGGQFFWCDFSSCLTFTMSDITVTAECLCCTPYDGFVLCPVVHGCLPIPWDSSDNCLHVCACLTYSSFDFGPKSSSTSWKHGRSR